MDASFAKPFIRGCSNVIQTMSGLPVTVGEIRTATPGEAFGVITGILGMSSVEYVGNMLIRFDRGSILEIVSAMLKENFTEVNQDIIDAVGEITNMIVGSAKRDFDQIGQKFDMASPAVVNGSEVFMSQACRGSALVIPFSVSKGTFVIEAAFEQRKK